MIRSFRSHLIALTAIALLASACSTTAPYARPTEPLSPEARQALYQEKRLVYDSWAGYQAGGGMPDGGEEGGFSYNSRVAGYMEASGDTGSAWRARQAQPYSLAGLAVGLGAVLTAVAIYPPSEKNVGALWGIAGPGLVGEIVLLEWGRRKHVKPAVESFNAYLRRDLGIVDEPSVPIEGPPLQQGLYGGFVGAWTISSTYDREDYFQIPGASNDWSSSHAADPSAEVLLGWKTAGPLAWEARLSGLVRPRHGRYYADGKPAWEGESSLTLAGLMPAWVLALPSMESGNPSELLFGCELAWSQLDMSVRRSNSTGTLLGAYRLRSQGLAVTPRVRWLAAVPFWKGWATGVELGYRILRFDSIPVADSSGSLAGRTSPDTTLRGTTSVVDFSGPVISFMVLFGRP